MTEEGRIPWRREWKPTSVFLLGEFHEERSLVGTVHGITKSWTQLSEEHFYFFMSKGKCIEDRTKGIIILSVLTT